MIVVETILDGYLLDNSSNIGTMLIKSLSIIQDLSNLEYKYVYLFAIKPLCRELTKIKSKYI